MKNKLFILWIVFFCSCNQQTHVSPVLDNMALIPYPNNIVSTNNSLKFSSINSIVGDQAVSYVLKIIHNEAKQLIGKLDVNNRKSSTSSSIFIQIVNDFNALSKEAYILEIKNDRVIIKGNSYDGIYRGWQTFSQIIKLADQRKSHYIPTGIITDSPEFNYRGTMLDVSRHFFSLSEVKRHIDLISEYKINHLHLHLSDDQGWRIEIKSRPKLTLIGSKTEVGGTVGGFYSQKEYKEIVKYASLKFITIVPEIDIPGHTNSALASYSKLNCDGKLKKPYIGTNVGFSTLCNNEYTFDFLEDVIREISEITPGPYFHIGGDESHVTSREDYLDFIYKTSQIVKKYGKSIIGWDDINIGEIPKNTVLQLWNKTQHEDTNLNDESEYQNKATLNVINGLNKGSKILISPASLMYMDMKYDSLTKLGLNWAGYIDVKTGYDWKIEEVFPEIPKEKIIGVEAPLWSETISNSSEIEFMTFPRLPGYAEIGWTKSSLRDWNNYKTRLAKHSGLWENNNVNYYKSQLIEWINNNTK